MPSEQLLGRCRRALRRCAAAGAEAAILVAYLAQAVAPPSWGAADNVTATPDPPASLAAAAGAYLAHLARAHYTASTCAVRAVHLRQFCTWAAAQGLTRTVAVTPMALERYQDHLRLVRTRTGAPLRLATQATRLTHVRTWWAWLTRTYGFSANPAATLVLPRLGSALPAVLTAAAADRVLARPDLATPLGVRDRAILETLYATGLRRSELLRLTRADVDAERHVLTVRQGKGRRDRVVPLGGRTIGWLDLYLHTVRPRWARSPDPGTVFLTARGRPLHPNHLSARVGAYVRAAQPGTPGACHLFRHTMATVMLEGGADIRFIQQMLGHAKLTTTQLYTHVSIRQLQVVYAATHPAGRTLGPALPLVAEPAFGTS